jgi:copper chaperone
MSEITLSVPDISCAHCERTILGALQREPGVKSVQVSIPAKTVRLDYDEGRLSLEQVKEILDEEGYPVAGTVEGEAPDSGRRGFIPLIRK